MWEKVKEQIISFVIAGVLLGGMGYLAKSNYDLQNSGLMTKDDLLAMKLVSEETFKGELISIQKNLESLKKENADLKQALGIWATQYLLSHKNENNTKTLEYVIDALSGILINKDGIVAILHFEDSKKVKILSYKDDAIQDILTDNKIKSVEVFTSKKNINLVPKSDNIKLYTISDNIDTNLIIPKESIAPRTIKDSVESNQKPLDILSDPTKLQNSNIIHTLEKERL